MDGGLAAGCLSPCHGFNGIVEQWKTSTHYATFISNLGGTEVDTWTGATACGNCHAIDAIEQRVANNITVAAGGVIAHLSHGELDYKSQAGALTEPLYAGSAKVAAVTCTTCHAVTDANDPHRTGAAYTPGSFPLRVPTGASDEAYIEKSGAAGTINGTSAGLIGTSNACVWCHKSRKDVTNYIGATSILTSPNWGPHEGPQSDVYTGAGGYHFTGRTYGTSTHQQKLACVDCHMPDVASNGGAPNHSFYPQVSACTPCHVGATSFDIGGGQGQIKAALFELQNALNTAGWITRATTPPYVPLTSAQLADGLFELDKTRPGGGPDGGPTALTADQAGAVYDYLIVARGGALGVHNPKYTKQLIFDAYFAVTGMPPTTLVRPQ
jgi:hypothetical protein